MDIINWNLAAKCNKFLVSQNLSNLFLNILIEPARLKHLRHNLL